MTTALSRHAQAQHLFADALDNPLAQQPAFDLFAGDESRHECHLGLYRGNLYAAWASALENAYPVLKMLVGDAFFTGMAIVYGREVPSQSGDLTVFGQHLSAFIRDFAPAAAYPYFADLARLEWALHCAYYAQDVVPWSVEQWMNMEGEQLLDARIRIHPACALVSSRYSISRIWEAHQRDADVSLPADPDSPSLSLVIRPQWRPRILDLSPAAYAMFDRLMAGATLGETLDAAATVDAGFDFARQWHAWIAANAVTGAY